MIRMKNSKNGVKKRNIFSDAFDKNNEEIYDKLDDYIYGKDIIEEKLKDINSNIEKLGKLCDRKKKSSYEEYSSVLNYNKNKLNEDLNNYRNKLVEILKNSSREEDIRRLQEDFMFKKLRVFDSNKSLEKLNKSLYEYENRINSLKQDYFFLDKQIKNLEEYNLYLKNKIKELEDDQKIKQNSYLNINNSNPSTVSLGNTNRKESLMNKEKSTFGQSESKKHSEGGQTSMDDADRLRMYFYKNENMIRQKLIMEEKNEKNKNKSYNNMRGFKNPIFDIFKQKVKIYEEKQVSQITEKVSNQEIFFNKSKDSKDATFTRSQISELKNKSLFTKLNNFDKKEVVKSFLEDFEIKSIIYSYLYDN